MPRSLIRAVTDDRRPGRATSVPERACAKGHWRSLRGMRRRGDLDSGRYQCRSNKPDKDEVGGSSPPKPTQVTQSSTTAQEALLSEARV